MDWLWLFLALIGLGLLWLMIVGVEKLIQRLREHDEMRRAVTEDIAKRTAQAEEDFLVNNYAKESAKDYIENADFDENDDSVLKSAIETLSSEELVKSVAKRMFGNPKGTNEITAT
ncbi:MAG: hypothetical protein MJ054_02550, partial [Clostridia bacterium]|nr:hypothetical protein [Clostridia bacterium]